MRPHSHHPPKISSCILLIYSLILVIIDQLSLSVILYKSNNKVYTFLSFKKCLVFIHIIFRNANKTQLLYFKLTDAMLTWVPSPPEYLSKEGWQGQVQNNKFIPIRHLCIIIACILNLHIFFRLFCSLRSMFSPAPLQIWVVSKPDLEWLWKSQNLKFKIFVCIRPFQGSLIYSQGNTF